MKFVKYKHHNKDMWVRKDLKGKHRDYCLCYQCKKFKPDNRALNCYTANFLFEVCKLRDVVIPIWECNKFEL